MQNAWKPQKIHENRQIQLKYRDNKFENSFSILLIPQNLLICTKLLSVGVVGIKILRKMLKNRRKCEKSPNSSKIPRGRFWQYDQRFSRTRKPYDSHQNFWFISHRKKVSWTISRAWPPSWILGPRPHYGQKMFLWRGLISIYI